MSETQVTAEAQVEVNDDLDVFTKDFFGQKPLETEPASSETEQDTDDKDESGVTEAQVTDQEDEDLDAELPAEEQPKKKTFQDRINELVKQREDEKRDGEKRLAELRKEFEDRIAALAPKQAAPKSAEPTPNDQNEDGSDKYPLGEFDPAYIRDLTRFELNQARVQDEIKAQEQRQQQEQQAAQTALVQSWNEKVEPAKVQYPDFQEKGQQLIDGFKDLDQGYAQYLTNVLMSMDKGPDVLYYLASNPAEATSIVNSGAQKATLALGRIEAKFVQADAEKAAAKPRISKAPPPPPVQSRGTAAGHIAVEGDTDDLDAFTAEFYKKPQRR